MQPAPNRHDPVSHDLAEVIALAGVSQRFIEEAEAQVQGYVQSFLDGGLPSFVASGPVDDKVDRLIRNANLRAARPLSKHTWDSYAQVIAQYCRFALYRRPQLSVLPVDPVHLGAFLEMLATAHIDPDTGEEMADPISVSRIDTVLAAIDKFHYLHRLPLPSDDRGIQRWRKATVRSLGRAARRPKLPIELDLLIRLVETTTGPYPTGVRDRALAFALADPTAVATKLANLRWTEVIISAGGVVLGEGADQILLPRRRLAIDPAEAFTELRRLSDDPAHGYVFGRPVGGFGGRSISAEGVSQQAISDAARRLAAAGGVSWAANTGWDDEALARVVDAIPARHPLDVRDHCLLLVGWQTALRRSNLSALRWNDCVDRADGVDITRRFSKTDQEGTGKTFQLVSGTKNHLLDPSATMREWGATIQRLTGQDPWTDLGGMPVFVGVTRSGQLRQALEPLSNEAIAKVIKGRIRLVGLEPDEYAAHSLRSGVLTSLARAGVHWLKMMDLSEHKDVETLKRYIRMGRGRQDNPIHELGL